MTAEHAAELEKDEAALRKHDRATLARMRAFAEKHDAPAFVFETLEALEKDCAE